MVLDELPPDATPVDVRWANGVRLVGYTLVAEAMRLPRSSQIVHLYFTADEPVKDNIVVHLRGDFVGRKGERRSPNMDHLPGDWLLPADKWPPGKIIDDATLFRIPIDGGKKVTFSVGLRVLDKWTRAKGRGKVIEPVSSDRPLTKDGRLVLGTTRYTKKEKRSVAKVLQRFEKSRKRAISAEQPY